jgi:hypothetical protein
MTWKECWDSTIQASHESSASFSPVVELSRQAIHFHLIVNPVADDQRLNRQDWCANIRYK